MPNYNLPLKNKLIYEPLTIDIKYMCFVTIDFLDTFKVSVF